MRTTSDDRTPGPDDAGRELVELQRLLLLLGDLSGRVDGVPSEATTQALRALQRRLDEPDTGEVTPALLSRAHADLSRLRADAHARAAAAAEAAADLYEQIAAARIADVEAARARVPARPTALSEEEAGASLLAAARARLDAASRWLRAAGLSIAHLARARDAQVRAHRAALAADPWFRSAAAAHLAAGDRLQGSRALDGAAKAAALAADALLADPT